MDAQHRSDPLIAVIGAEDPTDPIWVSLSAGIDDVRFVPDLTALGHELADADIVFAWQSRRDLIESGFHSASSLRWIQSASAGVDGLLFPELVESGVVLTNARGVYDRAIAETVMGFIFAFDKGLLTGLRRGWGMLEHRSNRLVADSTLLIVGAGSVGHAIGWSAKALGMRVLGVGRKAHDGDEVFERIAPVAELDELLVVADVVVDALPLTPESHHLFDMDAFRAMRKDALFINIGRGRTVDEEAIIRALRSGEIGGAALDVFEVEPLPTSSPLWDMDNVIVSPHV